MDNDKCKYPQVLERIEFIDKELKQSLLNIMREQNETTKTQQSKP